MIKEIETSFNMIINDIKEDINKTQLDIMLNANISLVNLYYRIGKILYDNSSWGNKFIDKLAMELKISFPNQKGFSIRNLKYMKSFYIEYKDELEFVQLVAQLPWTHNIVLIEKVKNINIRKWYIKKCIEEGWSKSVLLYQIDTDLYKRQVKSIKHNNFDLVLKHDSDLATYIMKDPYIFDILGLTENYKEKELENKMLERLKNILLELGNGFSFIGNQYKLTVGNKDFYIDLLFYHTKLKCYIAIELKKEHIGQIITYMKYIDEFIKL